MQPSQPGTSIAGRYRLERSLVDVPHVTLWRGQDEVLDRPVAVRIVDGEHPRVREVLTAARGVARIEDRRIARVLDADELTDGADGTDGIYVVTAWAEGRDLATVLRDGPLEPADAIAVVCDLADAVAGTHEQGITHGALDPTNVMLAGDELDVTVLGLAVDAVLWGADEDDKGTDDVRGLGALLYACLTARWPLEQTPHSSGLDPAPIVGARRCTPRQVRAAVPVGADTLCRRALGDAGAGEPFGEPAELAAALAELLEGRPRGRWRPSAWLGRGGHRTATR